MTQDEPNVSNRDVEPFLSDLVHDLRNLLDGVVMTLHQDSSPSPERTLQEVTFRNVYDVLRKTEDFRDRLRPHAPASGNSEIAPIVERALKALRVFLRERDVSLTSPESVYVAADSRALRRILENVIHVVTKLTGEGHSILVAIGRREGDVELTLDVPKLAAPTGPDELFSQDFKSGLDLWVSREMARSCGGDLSCERREKGLRLVLKLPKGKTYEEAKPELRSKRRVLVVDDDPDSAKSLALILSSAGFEVEICRDGASAIETARSFGPDALVLDLGLPGVDGYEVCRQLRRGPGGEALLVVAVSGRGDDETWAAARRAGFDDHILKPIDVGQLIRRLCE